MLIRLSGKGPLRDTIVDPDDLEDSNFVKKIKNSTSDKFHKIISIFDSHLSDLKPSVKSKLVYTRTAVMIGQKDLFVPDDLDSLWSEMTQAFGNDQELIMKAIGTFLRWRISLRPEDYWLLWVFNTGETNSKGERITISHYWVDESYEYHGIRSRKPCTVLDISRFEMRFNEKWGKI